MPEIEGPGPFWSPRICTWYHDHLDELLRSGFVPSDVLWCLSETLKLEGERTPPTRIKTKIRLVLAKFDPETGEMRETSESRGRGGRKRSKTRR